jgi:hypothetical protein
MIRGVVHNSYTPWFQMWQLFDYKIINPHSKKPLSLSVWRLVKRLPFPVWFFIPVERPERKACFCPHCCLPELLMWYALHLPMSHPNNTLCVSLPCIAENFSDVCVYIRLFVSVYYCMFIFKKRNPVSNKSFYSVVLLKFGNSRSLLIDVNTESDVYFQKRIDEL